MADGTLRITQKGPGKGEHAGGDLHVEIDDSDVDALENGTFRVLRVKATSKIDGTPGRYKELELNGEHHVIIEIAVDPKRGTSALVTVR